MSQYFGLFLIITLTIFVYCESCVVSNFESDFESLFSNNSSLCGNFQSWEVGSYTDVDVERPHTSSNKFIRPNTEFSCVTSFPFPMETAGIIEVKIYIESKSPNDFIAIIAKAIIPSGNDAVVATYMYNSAQPDFKDGWHVLRMATIGFASFDGYINLLGMQSEGSKILVDSMRYISPMNNIDSCSVYEDIQSTTVSVQNADDSEDKCVTYDFETDFENLFTLEKRLCDGFVTWNLGNYSSIGIGGIHGGSDLFLTPKTFQSCTASFPFDMTPGGTVEVNVYVEPVTSLDHIIVLVKKLVPEGIDTVAGMYIYEPSRATFVTGWNVLRVSVVDLSKFKGYLVFLGSAAEGAIVLVDSFRYIPPTISEDHESCAIY